MRSKHHFRRGGRLRAPLARLLVLSLPVVFALAGCGAGRVTANPSNSAFSIAPGTAIFDTSCTGCNATTGSGTFAEQFTATLTSGGAAPVTWSLSGGDSNSGPGTISATGLYTPPSYLSSDDAQVVVKATLAGKAGSAPIVATSVLTITPGFLQPLTPENAALGANGTATVTGYIAEAGGSLAINFALASSATGTGGGQGTLGAVDCHHSEAAFAWCTVAYTAPASISSTGSTWLVARIGSASVASTQILLNTGGVSSTPLAHEAAQKTAILLGSSGGNNKDYDVSGTQIVDCCSGTLGALVEDNTGRQYILSNNHVLARSDRGNVGDAIVQPGLIDNSCTPYGEGSGTTPIAALSSWLPLRARTTNADAALAQVNSHAVSATGNILELGALQANGTLAAAPPGISSTGGKGETASLSLRVAKSGRSTGLTCGSVSAISLDIQVSYFTNCAETKNYLTKTFTNQIAISGHQFSDAGDSGALVVDAANAEPVGLFFAGGRDAGGVGQAVASPASAVLSELGAATGSALSFVGGADHSVSCLNYGAGASTEAHALSTAEHARLQTALEQAHTVVNPATGILGISAGRSSDRPGEGALIVYVDEANHTQIPASLFGFRTVVIPTTTHALASGTVPSTAPAQTLSASVLAQAIAAKQVASRTLLGHNRAYFGVGVAQSLDNPAEAVLVLYVDRRNQPAQLPQMLNGLRTRYVVMDRFHVSRSYATPVQSPRHCRAHTPESKDAADPFQMNLFRFF